MKTVAWAALLAAWLLFGMVEGARAMDLPRTQGVPAATVESGQSAQGTGGAEDKDQRKAWISSIHPAAGPARPEPMPTEYWRQTVRRDTSSRR